MKLGRMILIRYLPLLFVFVYYYYYYYYPKKLGYNELYHLGEFST